MKDKDMKDKDMKDKDMKDKDAKKDDAKDKEGEEGQGQVIIPLLTGHLKCIYHASRASRSGFSCVIRVVSFNQARKGWFPT